jgi:hypothetical protein
MADDDSGTDKGDAGGKGKNGNTTPGDEETAQNAGASGGGRSQATRLIDLAKSAVTEWFHTPEGEAYAVAKINHHSENWPINSRGFWNWLHRRYFIETRSAPSDASMRQALSNLEAEALYDGREFPVHIRVAAYEGKVYLDLVDRERRMVEVEDVGWRIVGTAPVRFRRSRGMLPLPVPEPDGTLDELRQFINVDDDTWVLVVAWLIGTLRPDRPMPPLQITGEQGTGKSTQARILRAMVDPNFAALRSSPSDEEDLMVAARHSWVVGFDNLSTIDGALSDALCRLSTGAGLGRRQRYTDTEEVLFFGIRPVVWTGIENLILKEDLADRAISIILRLISEDRRRTESELWRAFTAARPRILAALLEVVSGALEALPHTTLENLPRMADFAQWVTAAEPALGWPTGRFLEVYAGYRRVTHASVIEASPVGRAVLDLLKIKREFTGTAQELLDALSAFVPQAIRNSRDWPKDARLLSGALTRLAPALRAEGIGVDRGQTSGTGSRKLWTLRRAGGATSDASDACDAPGAEPSPNQATPTASDASVPEGEKREDDLTRAAGVAGVAEFADFPGALIDPELLAPKDDPRWDFVRDLLRLVRTRFEFGSPLTTKEACEYVVSAHSLSRDAAYFTVLLGEQVCWMRTRRRLEDGTQVEVLEPLGQGGR